MGRLAICLLLGVAVFLGGTGCQAPRPATAAAAGETGEVRQVGYCDREADAPIAGTLGWLDAHPGLVCLGVGVIAAGAVAVGIALSVGSTFAHLF